MNSPQLLRTARVLAPHGGPPKVKFGQILASRPDIVPAPIGFTLAGGIVLAAHGSPGGGALGFALAGAGVLLGLAAVAWPRR